MYQLVLVFSKGKPKRPAYRYTDIIMEETFPMMPYKIKRPAI